MNRISNLIPIYIVVFLLVSIIPITAISEPPEKKMDPVDGYIHYINGTFSSQNLDGMVDANDSWSNEDKVGNVHVAKDPEPLAKVYMIVEGDRNGTYEFLWIGVDMISPNYLKPTHGQWVRIDWDQDGILDYEDHTGWNSSDGKDTANGTEWKIPWGKARVNPSKTPYQMNQTIVNNSFDILIHIQVFGYEASKDDCDDDDDDDSRCPDKKKDKGNKTKDDKDEDDDEDDEDKCDKGKNDNETKNETKSDSASFPGRPCAGPYKSTTIMVDVEPPEGNGSEGNYEDEDDDEDIENDCKHGKKSKPDKEKDGSSGKRDDKEKDNGNENGKKQSREKSARDLNESITGKFKGKYLEFEYNLTAEKLMDLKVYNISLFNKIFIENGSFEKEHVSNHLFKGDGAGAKLLAHDNPITLIQIKARTNITVFLKINSNWTLIKNESNITLSYDNFTVSLRFVGKPGADYLKVNNSNISALLFRSSQLKIMLKKIKCSENKSNQSGNDWFNETHEFIFDSIGLGILGGEITITGPSNIPNVIVNSYSEGFRIGVNDIEKYKISIIIDPNSKSDNFILVSMSKDTLKIVNDFDVEILVENTVIPEMNKINSISSNDLGFFRISDEEREQILLSIPQSTTQNITMQFIPEDKIDGETQTLAWSYLDFAMIIGVLLIVLIAGLYMYISRREDL